MLLGAAAGTRPGEVVGESEDRRVSCPESLKASANERETLAVAC